MTDSTEYFQVSLRDRVRTCGTSNATKFLKDGLIIVFDEKIDLETFRARRIPKFTSEAWLLSA